MISRIGSRFLGGISIIALALAQPVRAQQVYVASATNILGVLDFALNSASSVNQVSVIGTLSGIASGASLYGMGYGTDGNVYAVDSQANYYQLDTHTAALTMVGNAIPTASGDVYEAISDNKGNLYVVDSAYDLYRVDMTQPFQHAATLLGTINPGISSYLDGYIALDSQSHIYVGATSASPTGHDGLYLVAPNTTGGLDTTPVNNGITDTGFDQLTGGITINNTLYGFGGPANGSFYNVVNLNAATGAGTIDGQYGWPQGTDGQYVYAALQVRLAAVPEASSFCLLALMLGAGGGSLLLRRRRSVSP